MAEVTVFVDDAVLGRLPDICAKDGVAATTRFRIIEEVGKSGRLGILWLLVFAGPLGWIALLYLATRDSGEQLTVELPYSEAAYDRFVQARRLRDGAMVFGSLAGMGLILLTGWARLGGVGVVAIVGTLVVAAVVAFRGASGMWASSVGVRLDASRRWVTLRGVHSAFAAACRDRNQDHHLI